MTDNERLARWQGWKCISGDWVAPSGRCENLGMTPNYLNDDVAAMSLLDTLPEKGYCPLLGLNGTTNLWQCEIDKFYMHGGIRLHSPVVSDVDLGRTTRREAVCAAVLEMIGSETLSGKEDV